MNKKQLKAVLANILLPLGYTGTKDMFFHRIGDIFLIVDLFKSPHGGSFTVNIGMYVDEGGNLTQPPPFHQTHLPITLEWLVPKTICAELVSALNFELAMKDEARSTLISSAFVQYGLPFLNSLSTIEGIADYLSPEKRNFAGVTLALREIISQRTGRDYRLPELPKK
jgi:hypothetical protein